MRKKRGAIKRRALKGIHYFWSVVLYLVHFVMRFLWNWVIRSCLVYLYLAPQNWSHTTQVHKTLESVRRAGQQWAEGGRVLLIGPRGAGTRGASLLHIRPLVSSTLLDSPNKDILDLISTHKNRYLQKLWHIICPKNCQAVPNPDD